MTAPKFRLTKENYYDPKKPHLSVSKIKDYFRDPAFYKRRHVDRDPAVQFHVTGPVKRGALVDDILTRGATEIQKKVLKKDDPVLYEAQSSMDDRLLIESRYHDEAMEIVAHLAKHPAWQDNIDKAEMQVVLEGMLEGMPVCGLADRIEIDRDVNGNIATVRLIDLKVTSPIKQDSARKWLWNVMEMGYDMQFYLYQRLLAEQLKIPKERIICANVVASYVEAGLIKVGIYIVPQALVDAAEEKTRWAIRQIRDKKFSPKQVTWADAEILPFGLEGDDIEDEDEQDQ